MDGDGIVERAIEPKNDDKGSWDKDRKVKQMIRDIETMKETIRNVAERGSNGDLQKYTNP